MCGTSHIRCKCGQRIAQSCRCLCHVSHAPLTFHFLDKRLKVITQSIILSFKGHDHRLNHARYWFHPIQKSRVFFFFFAQTLHLCTYKITCMCICVCLSLHVFGRGVFNQIWPFITTVFLKYQNTISLHAGAQYVYTHNSARCTCLNDNKNRMEHLKINSQSAARVLSSHWVYSQKWTILMWSECEVSNTSVPCILGRHCNFEREVKSQSSQTNLIWICAGLSVFVSASVKWLWSVVFV